MRRGGIFSWSLMLTGFTCTYESLFVINEICNPAVCRHDGLEIVGKSLNKSGGGWSEVLNSDMVDQSHFSIKARRGEGRRAGDAGDCLQGFGIDEFEVVDGEVGGSVGDEVGAGAFQVDARVLFSGDGEVAGGQEGPANAGGVLPLIVGQADVSGRHGESVRLANRRVVDDFDGDIQVANHAVDERQLLEVLFSKDREIRGDEVEKFEDNGEDSVEVARAAGSAKISGEQRVGDENRVIGMVEGFFFGGEGEIDSCCCAKSEVLLEGLGVVSEVADAIKLDGIDEDRDHHGSGGADQLAGMAKEGEVPFVERTHRGNKGDRGRVIFDQLFYSVDVGYGRDHVCIVVLMRRKSTKKLFESLEVMRAV